MRDLINLTTKLFEDAISASNLKNRIIGQIEKTDDEELLDTIWTALNKGGLTDRIKGALKLDKDASKYIGEISQIIIDTPGSYDEKMSFLEGFPDGYIDIKRMLSGERVHFEDLIVDLGQKNAPMAFIHRLFDRLKDYQPETKGPGEFALAVLSPQISIFGEGDLKIGQFKIEVKANAPKPDPKTGLPKMSSGGGRVGGSGWLNHIGVGNIILKYFPDLDTKQTLGMTQFKKMVDTSKLSPEDKQRLGRELFSHIFEGKNVDVTPIVQALVTPGADAAKAFMLVAYEAYQAASNFDGMMLVNFGLQELKYFQDPRQMADEIYTPSFALISSNEAFAGRNILPTVTLAPQRVNKAALPAKKGDPVAIDQDLKNYADYLVKVRRIRDPQAELTNSIYHWLRQQWENKVPVATIKNTVTKQFPQLARQSATPVEQPEEPEDMSESIIIHPPRQKR